MAATTRSKKTGRNLSFSSNMADICLQIKCREKRDYPPWYFHIMIKDSRSMQDSYKPCRTVNFRNNVLLTHMGCHTTFLKITLNVYKATNNILPNAITIKHIWTLSAELSCAKPTFIQTTKWSAPMVTSEHLKPIKCHFSLAVWPNFTKHGWNETWLPPAKLIL